MKKATLLIVVLLTASVGMPTDGVQLDAFPKTSIAEDGTATWCGFCPNAYAGLEIVHGQFDYAKFISVRHYETSGSYGTPETDARNDYNGVSGLPTVVFDGQTNIVGAGTTTANTGEPYLTVVEGSTLKPSPVRVEIDSFDPVTGAVSATVTMYSTTDMLDNDSVMFILVEDDITSSHTHVTRDIVYETITLSGAGVFTTVNTSFVIDPTWTMANLQAVALVQRVADKEVLQSASTYLQPTYSVHGMVPFSRVLFGPPSGTYTTDQFTIMNLGALDTYTIELVVDNAPAGWEVEFVDDLGGIHTSTFVFALDNEVTAPFHVNVKPTSLGQADFHFEVTSANLTTTLSIPFAYFTEGLEIMLVDDDGGEDYELYFSDVLDTLGMTYGVWNRDISPLAVEVAQNFDMIIWNVGLGYPTLNADDQDFLTGYLDAGKSLFITGQDIGWELNDGSPSQWYQDYLHAIYIRDDTNILDLDGVSGDPITGGLNLHIAGGTGASNQAYPDEISAADASAVEILHYTGGFCGAVRSIDPTSNARVVYLGFGFEGIDSDLDRHDLLTAALEWMNPMIFTDGFESGDMLLWTTSTP